MNKLPAPNDPRKPPADADDENALPEGALLEGVTMEEEEPVAPVEADAASDEAGAVEAMVPFEAGGELTPRGQGAAVIADFVKRLPNAPGVYRMFDANGAVLYVGKARNLKKRVTSYTRIGLQSNRIIRMIQQTATMEFVTTRTETEALLLEANLIKRLRPRFNVLLRDDKSFPYILITDHEAPQLVKHRGARTRKGEYFGPFASAGAVGNTVTAMQRAFLIRTCTDSVYEARTRPCLLFQIKRCSGPCTREIALEDYAELVREAKGFLSGKSSAIRTELAEAMTAASADLDFERAAIYRDRLAALSHVQSYQGINPQGVEEADVVAVHQEGGQSCVQVFFFRTGQNWGNHAFYPRADKSLGPGEVLSAFLAQFYEDKPCPRLILISHEIEETELLAEALAEHAGHKVEIAVPKRGEKKDLVDHALANAREALGRNLAETSSQARLLEGVGTTFGLESPPRRIEVYDNSHIMGTNAVGAMIVAGPRGFVKNQYRKFNIRSEEITPGDDFGMMREVLTRRFSRLVKEHGSREAAPRDEDGFGPWPDLVFIDGGQGQLSAAKGILDELGLTEQVPLVGIAKGPDRDAGRETFFVPDREPFMMQPRDPVLYFVQRMRDEAHRFVIGSHRAKRKAAFTANPLDEIGGIGPTRKRALLAHFGTAKAVSRASVPDLLAVPGVSAQMAQTIYDFFHDRGE
ncbi:excinuclease ABC subunit C [Kaistia geumhonensis]|uniref:UvrABC system protein C n=2 Tax=Kaistia geumhonensis TaxID=410839 RepID=A0ABU0M2L4_9HYPH|nr:excinuclease ABC subunit C [Kaistia geumhonensis]